MMVYFRGLRFQLTEGFGCLMARLSRRGLTFYRAKLKLINDIVGLTINLIEAEGSPKFEESLLVHP